MFHSPKSAINGVKGIEIRGSRCKGIETPGALPVPLPVFFYCFINENRTIDG